MTTANGKPQTASSRLPFSVNAMLNVCNNTGQTANANAFHFVILFFIAFFNISLRKIRKNDIHHKYKSTHFRVQKPNDTRKKWYFHLRRSREEKTSYLTSNINVNVSSVTQRRVKKHWALQDNRYLKNSIFDFWRMNENTHS